MGDLPETGWWRRHPVATHFGLATLVVAAVVAIRMGIASIEPQLLTATRDMVLRILARGDYPNLVSIAGEAAGQPIHWLIFVFAGAPTLVALALAARGVGMPLPALLARLKPVGPDRQCRRPWAIYAWLLAIYLVGCLMFNFASGRDLLDFGRFDWFGAGAIGILIAPLIDEGGTLEELGWRGFAFPLLARGRHWLIAALVIGCLHWAWHLPREVVTLASGVDLALVVRGQFVFLCLCIALSILSCFAVMQAGGSVWPAIIVHGGTNAWAKALGEGAPVWLQVIDLRTAIVLITAVALALAVTVGQRARHGVSRPVD